MFAKQDIIEEILNIEWEMFQNVKSSIPAPCQDNPESFREIRASIYENWAEALLESYLHDLMQAKEKGRNLVTEKYARMDGLLPPLPRNPKIDEIVQIETEWQEELRQRYPALYDTVCRTTDSTGDGNNFSIYLRAELETYGDKTIELYHAQVEQAEKDGENLSIRMLERLVKKGGYKDMNHAEHQLVRQRDQSKHG